MLLLWPERGDDTVVKLIPNCGKINMFKTTIGSFSLSKIVTQAYSSRDLVVRRLTALVNIGPGNNKCRQTTSNYRHDLGQRCVTPYDVTKLQWVIALLSILSLYIVLKLIAWLVANEWLDGWTGGRMVKLIYVKIYMNYLKMLTFLKLI